MMPATQTMTAAQVFDEIATRKISLTPALGQWVAEVWFNGDRDHNRKRPVRAVNATASSPIGAALALLAILDGQPQEDEEEEFW